MKIANYIEDGRLGGPQSRIVAVAPHLKSDFETVVMMPRLNSGEFKKRCTSAGVRYVTGPITRLSRDYKLAFRYISFFIFEVSYLVIAFRRMNPDLVHVSGGAWQFKGVIAAWLAGRPVLWHLNDTSMPYVIKIIFSIVSRLASGLIYASEATKRYYRPLNRSHGIEFVIPAPVDTGYFDPDLFRFRLNPGIYDAPKDDFIVGIVANINPIKGLEVFLRCAAELRKKSDRYKFVVLGPVYSSQCQYFNTLKQLASELNIDGLTFLGGIADVRDFLIGFHVYVCSSHSESSPMAVWEAMAMGKAIVSTDVGDIPLYIENGKSGYLVNCGDFKSMAARIHELRGNPHLRQNFGLNARKTACRELDISLCVKRHSLAYSEIVGRVET